MLFLMIKVLIINAVVVGLYNLLFSEAFNFTGVIIVNALRKSLIVAASFAAFGVFNSAMAELVYKPLEQPVEAPNPNLKIEAVNEKFAAKYPKQFESWKATEKGDKIVYADEENPRLIVLWGGCERI